MSTDDHRAIEPLERRGCIRHRRDRVAVSESHIAAVVADAIDQGARAIAVRLEDSSATIAFDAVGSFTHYLGPARTNNIWSLGVDAQMALEICDGFRRQSALIAGGEALGPVRDHGSSDRRATRVSLMPIPDDESRTTRVDPAALRRRLEALCALHPAVSVTVDGVRLPRTLSGLVARMACSDPLHRRPLRFAGFRRGVQVDIALQWTVDDHAATIRSIVSGVERDIGARRPLLDGLLEAARVDIAEPVVSELLEPGLIAVIAVDGSGDPDDIAAAVHQVAREGLTAHHRTIGRILARRSRSHLEHTS